MPLENNSVCPELINIGQQGLDIHAPIPFTGPDGCKLLNQITKTGTEILSHVLCWLGPWLLWLDTFV